MVCFFWLSYCLKELNQEQDAENTIPVIGNFVLRTIHFYGEENSFWTAVFNRFVQLAKQFQQELPVFDHLKVNVAPSTELSLTLF